MSERPIRALEEFGVQLEGAERRWELRRPRRRRRLLGLAAAAAAALVAAPAAALNGGFDFGGNTPAPGQPGGPPPVVQNPTTPTVDVLALLLSRADGDQALRERIAPFGLRVRSEGRPVAPAAVGRVFGVQFPRKARFDSRKRLVLEPGSTGTIIVTRGRAPRAGETAGISGLSLVEVLPEVGAAVRREDPERTLAALRRAGFTVKVKYVIDNPDRGAVAATGVRDVDSPPDGTVVLAVTNASGQNTATAATRSLILEVAPADSRVAQSHP